MDYWSFAVLQANMSDLTVYIDRSSVRDSYLFYMGVYLRFKECFIIKGCILLIWDSGIIGYYMVLYRMVRFIRYFIEYKENGWEGDDVI